MNKSKELSDLEERILSDPANYNVDDSIGFLRNHPEDAEKFGEFLFDYTLIGNYELSHKKNEITKKIIHSLPSSISSILKPLFKIPDSLFINSRYRISSYLNIIKSKLIKNKDFLPDVVAKIISEAIEPTITTIHKELVYQNPELRQEYEKINPEIYNIIDEQFSRLRKTIELFKKNCYVPKVEHRDSKNPRLSKFGGAAPYMPKEGPKICPCNTDKLQTVFSLYVPSLPDEMKNLFPPDHEYVVVGYTCNSCYTELQVELFVDEQIDQLVYDDVPDFDTVFNEPRIVVGWSKKEILPSSCFDSGFEVPNKEDFSEEDLFFIDEILSTENSANYRTYLGGYPIFVQGDDSPPNHKLLLEMEESEASTNMWGDCGTCQVWMTTGDDFGSFVMQYACC